MPVQSPVPENLALAAGLRIVLVLPGATDLDLQGRIKGSLDLPLNEEGNDQAIRFCGELRQCEFDAIYSAPSLAARQTAKILSREETRVRVHEEFRNLDRGLWHGKRIDELRSGQPRIYRQWQDHPESVCPPGGETIDEARQRIGRLLKRICRRHRRGTVAVVIHEPAASILRQLVSPAKKLGNLWQAECRCGQWESIDVQSGERTASGNLDRTADGV